jgi:hypothetical protein
MAPPLAPAKHPNLAGVYRDRVADLQSALSSGNAPDALEAARVLIDKVIVHPPGDGGGPPGIELVGDLLAMLGAGGADWAKDPLGAAVLTAFTSSVKAGQGGNTFPSPTLLHPGRASSASPSSASSTPRCTGLGR